MKFLFLAAFILGAIIASSNGEGETYRAVRQANDIVILRYENENSGDGNFRWLTELSDGTKMEQSGQLRDGPDPEHPIQVIRGAYSYTSPEGQLINLQYVADENGFQPQGDHLPTPPPVPEAQAKPVNRNAGGRPAPPQPKFQNRRF